MNDRWTADKSEKPLVHVVRKEVESHRSFLTYVHDVRVCRPDVLAGVTKIRYQYVRLSAAASNSLIYLREPCPPDSLLIRETALDIA